MADSDIPNSEASPDWRELPYTRTDFWDALKLSPVPGSEGVYEGFAPQDWCITHGEDLYGVHGGFISALFISGSRQYIRSQNISSQPDPISMHIQFLEFVQQGAFRVSFTNLKLGPRQSVIQGEIISANPDFPKTYTVAICTMGDLNTVTGSCLEMPPIPTPDRERDCARWAPGLFFYMNPPTSSCRVYTPTGGPDPIWSPVVGQNKREQWQKLDNGKNFQLEDLGLVADIVPAIPLHYEKSPLAGVMKYAFITNSLTFDFVSDPAGQKEWILSRAIMNRLYNGRFDMDVQMIDVNGALVATVKHQCVMLRHRASKGGGEKKDRSLL